jgi:hypothetical protein
MGVNWITWYLQVEPPFGHQKETAAFYSFLENESKTETFKQKPILFPLLSGKKSHVNLDDFQSMRQLLFDWIQLNPNNRFVTHLSVSKPIPEGEFMVVQDIGDKDLFRMSKDKPGDFDLMFEGRYHL